MEPVEHIYRTVTRLQIKENPALCVRDDSPCSSRKGTKIDAIIIHHTAGSLLGTIIEQTAPDAKTSYHYIIDRDASIHRMVPVEKKAWHAGKGQLHGDTADVNRRSIGIALVNDGVGQDYPDEQLLAAAALCALLSIRHSIPVENVVGHRTVAIPPGRKIDPSPEFDWFLFLFSTLLFLNWHRSPDFPNERLPELFDAYGI